jgi:hypothetical protein
MLMHMLLLTQLSVLFKTITPKYIAFLPALIVILVFLTHLRYLAGMFCEEYVIRVSHSRIAFLLLEEDNESAPDKCFTIRCGEAKR